MHPHCITYVDAVTTNVTTEDPCSVDYDCSLTFKEERVIRRRLDGDSGDTLDECRSNCAAEFETGEGKGGRSLSESTDPRTRLRSSSRRSSISPSDCECYCLKLHDPCPITGRLNNYLLSSMLAC